MKKRLICLAGVFCMLLCLTACGEKDKPEPDDGLIEIAGGGGDRVTFETPEELIELLESGGFSYSCDITVREEGSEDDLGHASMDSMTFVASPTGNYEMFGYQDNGDDFICYQSDPIDDPANAVINIKTEKHSLVPLDVYLAGKYLEANFSTDGRYFDYGPSMGKEFFSSLAQNRLNSYASKIQEAIALNNGYETQNGVFVIGPFQTDLGITRTIEIRPESQGFVLIETNTYGEGTQMAELNFRFGPGLEVPDDSLVYTSEDEAWLEENSSYISQTVW